ncbi:MAG: hypothetical protein NTW99_07645 [Chloroflexi bacterium]|nr:hypothetical protein [Chloroflexota bacterium]
MKNILNRKVLIAALVIASVLLCTSLVYILVRRPAAPAPDLTPASAVLTVIPAPTSTPRTLPPTLTPIPPTAMPSPTPVAGEIAIGVYVQVATGGDALRVRAEPGLSTAPLFLAFDSEVFLVTNGPEQADGYTWWYLTASYDASRAGWAAQDFLTVIPSP